MKVLVVWTRAHPQSWEELESSQWRQHPKKPDPVGGEPIDDLEGWVYALNVQGVQFEGHDHYAVEDILDGIRVTIWTDTYPQGKFARVWTFRPLSPDPRFGGALNTQQSQVVYAEPAMFALLTRDGPVENTEFRPWTDFVPPPSETVRHGKLLPGDLLAEHERKVFERVAGWREWGPDGYVPPQRPLGRFQTSRGTRTYFQRDTNLANGIHAATHEDAFELTAGTGQLESITLAGGASAQAWTFVTPSGEPDSDQWPTGNYRCQLDVSVAGPDITYGLRTVGTNTGHFARVNAAITSDLETKTQIEAAFSGTGLRLATTGSVSWAAGATSDRFECFVVATRAASHASQTLELTFDADAFADGPWVAAVVGHQEVSMDAFFIG